MKFNGKPSCLFAMLLVASIALSGCGGREERQAKHMEKGKAYLAQADYDKARIEFRNVLQIDPKNADAYYLSGLLEEKQNNGAKAFGNYSKVLELNPEHLDAKARLGKMYLLSNDTAKAEKMVGDILAKRPADPAAHTLKAALMARKGDAVGAVQEASQVIAADPSQFEAVSLLAALYAKQGDEAKAQAVLENGIKANPGNIPLRMDLAVVAMKHNDIAKAERQLIEIVAADPKRLEYRTNLAVFYTRTNQADKAEKALRDAIQIDPEDETRYLLLTEFLATRKGPEVAEKELLSVAQSRPKAYKLRFGLAKLYQAMNSPEKQRQIYLDIIDRDKTGPEGLKARNQLAEVEARAGKREAAEKLIAEVLKENPRDSQALLLRGKMSLVNGDAKDAIVDFRSLLKEQPDSVEFLGLLAKAHLTNKEPELAGEIFNNAVAKFPDNPNVRMARADFLAATQDYDGALKEIDAVVAADPQNLRALQAKAETEVARKNWSAAEGAMAKFKAAAPEQPIGYYRLGLIYQAQKKYEQALTEFETALSKAPGTTEPLAAIVNVLVVQGKADKAVARIGQVIQATPDNLAAHLLLGAAYASQKKYADADGAFRKAIQLNPRASAAYMDLANLSLTRGDAKTAIQSLRQGLAAVPGDVGMSMLLAEAYQRSGDNDKAVAEYETVLKNNPGIDAASNNLASLLAEKGGKANLDKALGLAKRFESSSTPAFVDTLGWIYFMSGQNDLALPLLQKAADKEPQTAIFQYHLGMALYKKGDMKAAKTALQKAVDSKSSFPGIEEAKGVLAKI